jgi:hypothetical protein
MSTRRVCARDLILTVAWFSPFASGGGKVMLRKVGCNGTLFRLLGAAEEYCGLLRTFASDFLIISSAGELPHHPNHRAISIE